ncbi:MAG: glycosyltransferase family 39 protein [Hyphomicrobiaceae bacterium]|nr:glycosyltransferase family 39 protein [Hyphomicrobiaceae bacterium]
MATRAGAAGDQHGAGWLRTLIAVLGVLLAIRLLALGVNATDLFFDEAQYWSWSLEPAFGYYSKPPLIAWIIGAATGACGMSEFCVRLPSPIIHTATALVVYGLAARLYDRRTGFWSAVVFATLPGVSLSAGIISTDVPLLLFWAVTLYGFVRLLDTERWWPALLLGLALGLGLNAKYAMVYFGLSAAVYIVVVPEGRCLLRDARIYAALLIGGLLIAPNLIWNAQNSFATFAHTADNAKWSGPLVNPGEALEFFGAQLGVFGPILFASLLVIAARAWRRGLPSPDRLLLAFALPVIVVVTAQALLSRAHANWAAVSYVSASVLVTATLIRELSWRWLKASLALHAAILAGIGLATAAAGSIRLPGAGDPFARTLGWRALAEETAAVLAEARRAGKPFGAVLTEDRAVTAELIYYMREEATPVFAWREHGRPRDHYELTRAYVNGAPEPVLLVTLRRTAGRPGDAFALAEPVLQRDIAAGAGPARRVAFYRLEGFKAR